LICLVAIPFFLKHDPGYAFRAAIRVILDVDFTQWTDGGLEKFLHYIVGWKLGLTQTDKGNSSNLHLGFIHVSREVGYDNFLNRLRDGTSWFRGICYPGLGGGGCTGGSKDLSPCTITTAPTLHMLSCVGSSDDLHWEQKKTVRRGHLDATGRQNKHHRGICPLV
jgi:hypothetical protein